MAKRCLIAGVATLLLNATLTAADTAVTQPPLDLSDAVRMALGQNFRVRGDVLAARSADTRVGEAAGAFDPIVSARANEFDEVYQADIGQTYRLSGRDAAADVAGVLPTGTVYQLGVQSTEYDGFDNGRVTIGSVVVTQPLLRGAGFAYNMADLRVARKDAEISEASLGQTVVDVVTETQFAFFDAQLAQQNVEVAAQSLELARRLLEENRERAQLGSLASSDLLQAEAEVAAREERLYEARQLEVEAFNSLRTLIYGHADRALQPLMLAPIHTPEPVEVDPRGDYSVALQLRPDYQQAVLGLDRNRIEELRARNVTLPALDLVGRADWRATGDDLGTTVGDLRHDDDPSYSVGLVLSMPVGNRTARAQALRSRIEKRRQETTLSQLEQQILLDMRTAAERIHNGWQRVLTASRSRELAERALEAEEQRFQIGTSTTFVLIRLQTDLASAKVRELLVINEYRKAVIEYERQRGTTLAAWHIDVGTVRQALR